MDSKRPEIDKSAIERKRPGSPRVELSEDKKTEALVKLAEAVLYYDDKTKRGGFAYRDPELGMPVEECEVELLKTLINEGELNFWDASIDLASPTGVNAEGFNRACQRIVTGLDLEVTVQV